MLEVSHYIIYHQAPSLVTQTVKHLPAIQETGVRSLGWEDHLEKEMTTHSSTFAWKILWTEESGRLQLQRVGQDWVTSLIHSPGPGGIMLPFKNVLDLTLKILFNHISWACLLILCIKKWEIHISPFCRIPKYYGHLKKKCPCNCVRTSYFFYGILLLPERMTDKLLLLRLGLWQTFPWT